MMHKEQLKNGHLKKLFCDASTEMGEPPSPFWFMLLSWNLDQNDKNNKLWRGDNVWGSTIWPAFFEPL